MFSELRPKVVVAAAELHPAVLLWVPAEWPEGCSSLVLFPVPGRAMQSVPGLPLCTAGGAGASQCLELCSEGARELQGLGGGDQPLWRAAGVCALQGWGKELSSQAGQQHHGREGSHFY